MWNFYSVTHPEQITIPLTPADFNLPEEEVTLTTEDGLRLSAWFIEAPSTKGALIVLHGYPTEKSDMLFIASELYPDFTLLLLDMRSFGGSEGTRTTFGIEERRDVRAGVDFIFSRGYERVGVFGFSVGGAVAIIAATEDKRITAVASYASFSDLKTLGEKAYSNLGVLKKPMTQLMLLWARIVFGESPRDISPLKAAERLNIPILLVHSKDDETIPFAHALRLKGALSANKEAEFYFLEEGLHGTLPSEFYTKLTAFFKKSF